MTLLDRFRSQIARQKHTDPAVRLAFVEEVPLDEREVIASIAREDEDPRVRRAAVAKLMDPAALGRIAGEDPDEDVREQAGVMLRDIALEAFEGVAEGDSLEAVEAIGDSRALAHVARSAVREIVAIRALSRVSDARLVGAIARHAACEGARKGAVQMLVERAEHAELLAVAMNSEYKDTALAAMDQITDQAELEQIAAGGRNKGAVTRARGILREAGEQAGREAAAAADMAQGVAPAEQALAENVRRPAEPPLEHAAHDEAERLDSERAQDEAAALDADLRRARALEDAAAREREREREAAAREADAQGKREALVRLQQLVARIEPLPAKDGLTLKAADRALHDIREALASVPPLPTRQDYHDVTHRLKSVLEALTPRALELREADEWQRWANVNVQEQLIVRMEALRGAEDPEETITRVRELQQQWKEAADVPRAKADLLWRRFKAAHDEVWAGCEAHFARQAQVRAENLARKIALCEKAETLAQSTSWLQTADEIKRLQAEWKTIGPVPRGQEKAIWDRFRAPCDRFFVRRNEDLARRKAQWSENLGRKDALCARAEALAESSDWETAAAGIRQVQAEWKAIGPVKQSKSEAIWRRFRAACDRFFARYAQRHEVARAERVAAREALCAELEALTGGQPDQADPAAPPDLLSTVRGVRARWQQELAARGVDPDGARALDARFGSALAAVTGRWPAAFAGTELDPDANRKRLEALARKMEELAASVAGPAAQGPEAQTPADRLAAMLKEALASNTIGGKADEESRWRAAAEEVRQAQATWARIGFVEPGARRPIEDRFQRACRRITERRR